MKGKAFTYFKTEFNKQIQIEGQNQPQVVRQTPLYRHLAHKENGELESIRTGLLIRKKICCSPDFSGVPKKGGTKPKVASETTSYLELVFSTISNMNRWASKLKNKTTQSRLCSFAFLCNPYTRGEAGNARLLTGQGLAQPLYLPDLLTAPHLRAVRWLIGSPRKAWWERDLFGSGADHLFFWLAVLNLASQKGLYQGNRTVLKN